MLMLVPGPDCFFNGPVIYYPLAFSWSKAAHQIPDDFLEEYQYTFTKFLTTCHKSTETDSQGSLKSLSRYLTDN